MMDDNFKKRRMEFNAKCNKNIFEGLIFINLSNKPSDFNEFISLLKPFISHGLGKSKIALRKVYEIEGNGNWHWIIFMSVIIVTHLILNIVMFFHSKDYIQSYGAGSNTGPESLSFKTLLNDWNKKVDKLDILGANTQKTNFQTSIEVLKEHLLVVGDYLKQNLVNLHQS